MKLTSLEPRDRSKSAYLVNIYTPLVAIAACVLFTALFFGLIGRSAQEYQATGFYCQPNGVVHFPWKDADSSPGDIYDQTSDLWDSSLFLSITLGFGEFDFAWAKATDIAWDLLVGRGGQVLLAALAYPIFRRSLLLCLERRAVPFDIIAALTFSKISLESAMRIARDLRTSFQHEHASATVNGATPQSNFAAVMSCSLQAVSKAWKAFVSCNWVFLGLLFASIYIILFPTFLSAMTGYQALSTAYIAMPGDLNLIEASELQLYVLVVEDGSRIGLSDHYRVTQKEQELYQTISDCKSLRRRNSVHCFT